MFSNLGLLSSARCPDPSCGRPRCFFAHAEASSSKSTLPIKQDIPSTVRQPVKRRSEAEEEERIRGVVRRVTGEKDKRTTNSASVQRKTENGIGMTGKNEGKLDRNRSPHTTPAPTRPTSTAVSTSAPINTARPPVLPIALKPSPHPRPDRQKGLNTLYTQYAKLYAPILHFSPDLAHTSAFAQEAETAAASSNVRIYKTAIHQAAVSISKRSPPDTLDHPSIGTVKESRVAHEVAEKEKLSKLTREKIEKYCLPIDQFQTWRYPNPLDTSLTDIPPDEVKKDGEGEERVCSKCKVPFVVSSNNIEERTKNGECKFHYGRTLPERIEGRRKWIYTCCGKERGEGGCQDYIHVFSEEDDDAALARRVPYKTTAQVIGKGDGGLGRWNEVVAMDCEMIYTTAGISLGRVTIVDENGGILLDELVRQTVPVLDVNTRFSGITPDQLQTAVMDLPAVRAAACMFIGTETIIVGHGLENDLRALRLLHSKIIDTAIVFPHDKGPPFRRALRDIVKEKLGYFIQDRTSDLGHSSAVDAKSTLEALKWKVREDSE